MEFRLLERFMVKLLHNLHETKTKLNTKLAQKVSFQFGVRFRVSLVILLFSVSLVIAPLGAKAAILYLEPAVGQYQPGDTFGVEIKIDTEGECINAIEGNLKFSQNILKAADFSRGESIITLWIKPPEFNQENGLVSWSGGIPNGYCGRIPGDPGASNLLGKIIFRIPEMMVGEPKGNLAKVEFLNTSQVFLNDGKGTKAKLTTQGASFEILSKLESSKDEWQEEIKKDDIPPESFKIEISQDPAIFEGKYFIIFSTTDKQTGIDRYEILEAEKRGWLRKLTQKEIKEEWKVGGSPYLLKDQSLRSTIKVKAIDKAGNYWMEILKARNKSKTPWKIYIGLGIILILVIVIVRRNIKKKIKNHESKIKEI